MKLLIKKLWFPHNIDIVASALFKIPQMQEQFDEGWEYAGEMRPRGIKVCSNYWPAKTILEKLVMPDKDVCLVLTSMDLQGDYGRIHGRGQNRKAIASSDGFTNGYGVFHPEDIGFNAMAFGEIGHAIGLLHHNTNPLAPCEMSHNLYPKPNWQSLEDIRFCDNCDSQIK
ncbi:MAG: hypothetical protein AABX65_03750 [Nanoarchaeota archaeon]